jgi:hypothetical protein
VTYKRAELKAGINDGVSRIVFDFSMRSHKFGSPKLPRKYGKAPRDRHEIQN